MPSLLKTQSQHQNDDSSNNYKNKNNNTNNNNNNKLGQGKGDYQLHPEVLTPRAFRHDAEIQPRCRPGTLRHMSTRASRRFCFPSFSMFVHAITLCFLLYVRLCIHMELSPLMLTCLFCAQIAMILSPTILNLPVDLAMGVIIPVHMNVGLTGIIEDYVPKAYQSGTFMGLIAVTAITALGLLKINLCGVGKRPNMPLYMRHSFLEFVSEWRLTLACSPRHCRVCQVPVEEAQGDELGRLGLNETGYIDIGLGWESNFYKVKVH
jgi:succinate dehydrogenase hydrophobic anchor subunit